MEPKVTKKDLIGDLENFPIEVVEKMLVEQFKQFGKNDITVFQYNRNDGKKGFCWDNTADGHGFWSDVIHFENFDRFFERYPKRYPLHPKSKKVYIRGDELNGKNVIKELESRGGINQHDFSGAANNLLYFIDPITNYIVKASKLEVALQNLLKTVYTEISPSEDAMVELTMEEIAEKLGVDVKLLRIKK
jgi:hypothetical protein